LPEQFRKAIQPQDLAAINNAIQDLSSNGKDLAEIYVLMLEGTCSIRYRIERIING
jgi:hypothetical protein